MKLKEIHTSTGSGSIIRRLPICRNCTANTLDFSYMGPKAGVFESEGVASVSWHECKL
jgi:hypothetical protein